MKFKVVNLALCIGIANAAIAAEQHPNEESSTSFDTIIVTGEKQDRNLKETTTSVSVIGDDKLRTTQYVTVRDAIQGAPNVNIQAGQVPTIRGADGNGGAGGFFGVAGGANARVSMLVDGVPDPFIAIFAGDSGLWDIEQIEVFRGPQSTNNGRNSIAGSVYLKTKDPTFDWEGKVRLGYNDNESNFDTAVMVSGPVIEDTLAFRFSGQMLDQSVLVNNEAFDDNPAHYDLDGYDSDNARLKMLWTPTEQFDAMLSYSSLKEEGVQSRRYFTNTTDYILAFPSNQYVDNDTLSLNLGYTFNDSTSLDVLLADQDYTIGYDSYRSTTAAQQQFRTDQDSTNVDIKLNYGEDSDVLFGHLGLAYYDREQVINSTGATVYDGIDNSDSQAVYGELNYAINEALLITGGVRYQEETQQRDFDYPASDILVDLDLEEEIFLPSLALQYDINEDTRLGFSARKGYNSAGGSAHPVFGTYFFYDKEEVNAYELSVRSSLADDAITLRANLFLNDYDGYQATDRVLGITNVDAETTGAEIEATALVSSELEVSVGIGILNSNITDGRSLSSITDNELPKAPKTTASISGTYFLNDHVDLGASVKYTGGYFTDLSNTETNKTGGFSTIDLTANYENGPWLISAFINNLTDKMAIRNYVAQGPSTYYDIIEPRTIGASVTYSFF